MDDVTAVNLVVDWVDEKVVAKAEQKEILMAVLLAN